MLFIFQPLLHARQTRPIATHILVGNLPRAADVPPAIPTESTAGVISTTPPAHASDGLAHYIDARLSEGRFRID